MPMSDRSTMCAGFVSAVRIESLSGSEPASSADCLGNTVASAFVAPCNDGTNTAMCCVDLVAPVKLRTLVERTVDFAMTNCEDLLRRLADD